MFILGVFVGVLAMRFLYRCEPKYTIAPPTEPRNWTPEEWAELLAIGAKWGDNEKAEENTS